MAFTTKSGDSRRRLVPHLLLVVLAVWLAWMDKMLQFIDKAGASTWTVWQWSAAQWMPWPFSSFACSIQARIWARWMDSFSSTQEGTVWKVPVVNVSKIPPSELLEAVESLHGKDWRSRPLLLQNFWEDGWSTADRKVSLARLAKEPLSIPYFQDASIPGALTPDSKASIADIVANITGTEDCRHKITTQLFFEEYPELIQDIIPSQVVTTLFGNYFAPRHILGTGPFNVFPAMTTVPLFVARSVTNDASSRARTDLHCEPIGNVAVQVEGTKQWTLVLPEETFRLKPAAAPDGRAFFASFATNLTQANRAYVTTQAGEALWVPPWTWHRVDYVSDHHNDIAVGASLFHFRPVEFLQNNPLFAWLIIPSLIRELVGYNTQ